MRVGYIQFRRSLSPQAFSETLLASTHSKHIHISRIVTNLSLDRTPLVPAVAHPFLLAFEAFVGNPLQINLDPIPPLRIFMPHNRCVSLPLRHGLLTVFVATPPISQIKITPPPHIHSFDIEHTPRVLLTCTASSLCKQDYQ
jgi:hypothetical protein